MLISKSCGVITEVNTSIPLEVRKGLEFTEGSPVITVIPPALGKGEGGVASQDPLYTREHKLENQESGSPRDTQAEAVSPPSEVYYKKQILPNYRLKCFLRLISLVLAKACRIMLLLLSFFLFFFLFFFFFFFFFFF